MSYYIVEGGRILNGSIKPSGSKNASLPIIAASILSGKVTKLYNVPNIHDIQITLKILKHLGCKVKRTNDKIIIDSSNINKYEIPYDLMRQMRSSVMMAGAIVGRFKKATFSYPGGCEIGARPIDLHLNGFRKLGININEESGFIKCSCDKIIGTEIHLDFPSVGATENIMLASVFGKGETIITNAAMEPEIEDLQKFLNKMGAKIEGAGSNVIRITGVQQLKDVSYTIMPDRIEVGTLLCSAAITGGQIEVNNVIPEHITPVLHKLQESGCKLDVNKDTVHLVAPKRLIATEIKTMPYPGFPTDMQSIYGSLLSVSKGTSVIIENIFENRYKYAHELIRMGAKVTIEGKMAIFKGVRKLCRCGSLFNRFKRWGIPCSCSTASKRKNKNTKYRIYIKRL